MTGHGGNEFLKFQDNEEISAFDIADAFEQMWQKNRQAFLVRIYSFLSSVNLTAYRHVVDPGIMKYSS
jgi:glycosylphosphatidylinositol transamidase (GPIT) subunit GPI8